MFCCMFLLIINVFLIFVWFVFIWNELELEVLGEKSVLFLNKDCKIFKKIFVVKMYVIKICMIVL